MNQTSLMRALQEFLAQARSAAVFEGGEEMFVFAEGEDSARYSVAGDERKCLLHLWSAERNIVRRVLDAENRNDALILKVERFGQTKPVRLEIVRDRDRRPAAARHQERRDYARGLERVLARKFPEFAVSRFSSAMDLERSFGGVYARGTLTRGRSLFAALGTNAQETQAAVDGSLTFGLLWLERCREKLPRHAAEGLKLIAPRGKSGVVRERMACLNQSAAKLELYELDEREGELEAVDISDRGNVSTRLARAFDRERAKERFAAAIARALGITPEPDAVEVAAVSPAEVSLRLRGLEFARARIAPEIARAPGSEMELTFGAGTNETALSEETAPAIRELIAELFRARRANGDSRHPLFRMQAERWLEALVARNVCALEPTLDPQRVYSQLPAIAAGDRGMLDVLAVTRDRRLAVVELKADEDIHLPLQGLDYWARVAWHHARGEFRAFGYFAEAELGPLPPRLLLVAPALRVHPMTDALLRYLAPEIEWELIGIDERWREQVKVVFRKRRPQV